MQRKSYRYKVKDSKKKILTGRAAGPDISRVRNALEEKGYEILSLMEEKSIWQRLSLFNRISAKERSLLYRELATMLKAGVGIAQAIEVCSDTPNRRLKRVLQDVYVTLENGFPLSSALAAHGRVFPAVEIGVIKSGEATGNLVKVLLQLSDTATRLAKFAGKIRGALVYPSFIFLVMITMGAIILTKVIPPIKDIFASAGSELPLSTRFLLGMTDFLITRWHLLILLAVLLIIGLKVFGLTKPGRWTYSYIALNFPVFGSLARKGYLARFNRTLSLLVNSGVPIIQAVGIIEETTDNMIYRQSLKDLSTSLEQGSAVSVSLQKSRYFPRLMTQLLLVGQQSGDLGGAAGTLAEFYENDVEAALQNFSALLEPFVIVILGCAVGFIIISVLQPIYNLSGAF